jgi:tripeptidyl-peptidase-1
MSEATTGTRVMMESMVPRSSFTKLGPSSKDKRHEVVFALKQNNLDIIERKVLERATPGNPDYQNWMSFNDISALIKNEVATSFVHSWLGAFPDIHVSWKSRRGEYVRASASIATWEILFDTSFFEWHDSFHSRVVSRCEQYSLPGEAEAHIVAVFHTSQAPSALLKLGATGGKEFLASVALSEPVTVPYLNEYYDIASNIGNSTQNMSVFETDEVYFSQADLHTFQTTFSLTEQSAIDIGGGAVAESVCSINANNSCGEGNLDIQYIMGMSQVNGGIYWYNNYNSSDFGDSLVAWITAVADDPNPPVVSSMSYGTPEQLLAASILSSFSTEAMKTTGIGVSIMVASGDNGAIGNYCTECFKHLDSSPYNCPCYANSGSDILSWTVSNSWTGTGYFPSFPATCPYVTAVGATMGEASTVPAVGTSEQVCMSTPTTFGSGNEATDVLITSGGGFSTYFSQPSWQADAVSGYFDTLDSLPHDGYNSQGRGIPDVAVLGVDYTVVYGGLAYNGVYGTSCSAPTFAGIVSLVNAARLLEGKGPVGWINPSLYSASAAALFNDITVGNNSYCELGNPKCPSGFEAAVGWDPSSGWGSVTLPNLKTILGSSGTPTATPTSSQQSSHLSKGELAGVIVGSTVGGIIVVAAIAFVIKGFFARPPPMAATTGATMNSELL